KLKREATLVSLQHTSYFQAIALADREWERANVTRAQELLDGCPAALRGWEWYRLRHAFALSLKGRTIPLRDCQVTAVAWSPDGARLASAGADHTVRIWEPTRDEAVRVFNRHTGAVSSVAWSAAVDGREWVASCGADRAVRLWDPANGQEITMIPVEGP